IAADGGDAAGTVDKAVKGKDREPTKAIDDMVAKLIKIGEEANREEIQTTDAIKRTTEIRIALGVIVTLVITGGLAWVILSSITTPLATLEKTMQEISRTNDLTMRAKICGGDEIARMGGAFNGMIDKLQAVVRRVSQAASEVNGASSELAGSAAQLTNSV